MTATPSSTTEWRKLADAVQHADSDNFAVPAFQAGEALRAACDAIDELEGLRKASGMGASLPCMHCAGVFKEWRKAQARVRELEQKLNHESYVSDKRAQERDKAEASLKVAIAALEHYAEPNGLGEESVAREALAKLKGEP